MLAQLQGKEEPPDILVVSARTTDRGDRFVTLLRADPSLAELAIIVLVPPLRGEGGIAHPRGEPRQEGLRLTSPFNPVELYAVVNRILGRPIVHGAEGSAGSP